MTTNDHALPWGDIFQPDGHLSETALSCIADGQLDLVMAAALVHLDGCDRCAHLLGETALLSLSAAEAIASLPVQQLVPVRAPAVAQVPAVVQAPVSLPVRSPRRARRPLPIAAIAAALMVALVTAGPSLVDLVQGVPATLAGARTALPFMFRVASAFARAPWVRGSTGLLLECASALLLAGIGLQVARTTSRARSFQEEGGV